MTVILALQAVYVLSGVLFNVASLRRQQAGLPRLTPTDPSRGLRSMTTAAAITACYFVLPVWIYIFGWLVFAFRIFTLAVWPHYRAIALTKNLDGYATPVSAQLALAINALGCVCGLLATAALFH